MNVVMSPTHEVERRRPAPDRPWEVVEISEFWTRYRHAHTGAMVLSAVELAADSSGDHLEWHVSVSGPKATRAGTGLMQVVRRDFGLEAAIEDNHVPNGVVRNLWLRVNPDTRGPCDCEGEREEVYPIPGAGEDGGEYLYREAPEVRT